MFDQENDQWVLNTPKISSIKWWPGDLGLLGTHAAIFAQTVVNGENHGVNAFMVPIRDPESHRQLPGLEIGDIGPKFGFEYKDNGYAILKDVRIPRENLFKRYIEVTKDGEVEVKGNPLVVYSIMMKTRLQVMIVSQLCLAKALTIAIRYAFVRTQFKS